MREKILHCFLWKLKDITNNLESIKQSGYTAVQVSPLQPIKKGNEWWCDYQPIAFKVGNRYGSKQDLIELCSKAREKGIKIIVDVVLRHVAGRSDGKLVPHEDVDNALKSNPRFWTNAENTTDYHNRTAAITKAFGMPMLDYNNKELQDIYINYLDDLRECGASGFRVDMGKHFALNEEGSNFWERVFGRHSSLFNYAECLECSKELLDKYTKFIKVLTDSTASNKEKMVIFIMSHDTKETWGLTKKMDDKVIVKEWEHLLKTNDKSDVLFYPRRFSNLWRSEEIKRINLKY